MRGKWGLTLLLMCWAAIMHAQMLLPLSLPDSGVSSVALVADMHVNAYGITNKTLLSAYRGDAIAGDEVQDIANRLQPNNRLGYELFSSLMCTKALQDKKFDYVRLGVFHTQIAYSRLSGDLLKIVLQGNKQFEDQQAQMNAQYRYINMQRVSATVGATKGAMRYEYGVSVLHGMRFQQVKITDSWLYTAPYGEYLESQVHYESINTAAKMASGIGLALEAMVHYTKGKHTFTAALSDLGGLWWASGNRSSLDSTYRFNGLRVDNILNPQELNTQNLNADSASHLLGLKEDQGGKLSGAPARLHVQMRRRVSEKWQVAVGAQHIVAFNHLPLVYMQGYYALNTTSSLEPQVSYGGFGGINVGIGYKRWIGSHLQLQVATRYLDGWALPGIRAGAGAQIIITYNL